MSFLADGSIHHRDRNVFWTPKGAPYFASTIAFRGNYTADNGRLNDSQSFVYDASSLTGDLCYLFAVIEPDRTIVPPAGWTEITTFSIGSGGSGARCHVYYRIKQAGDLNFTIGCSGGLGFIFIYQGSLSGFNATQFLGPSGVLLDQPSSATITFPNIAVNASNTLAFVFVIRSASGSPWFDVTNNGNMTGVVKPINTQLSAGVSAQMQLGCAYGTVATARALGGVLGNATTGAATFSCCAVSFR